MENEILMLGKAGQVSEALAGLLGRRAQCYGKDVLDLASAQFAPRFAEILASQPFAAVINAAAYTQVDKAESEREQAFRINAEAVSNIAQLCVAAGVPLVHYSTDYVFNGSGSTPWKETDATGPLNVYGASKREGEIAIEQAGGTYLVFRTSWVYDAWGKNFFNTMVRLFGEKETLKVVNDQVGAPTYALHLAQASLTVLQKALAMEKFPSGIYHVCNSGETSWHGFAQAIFALARMRDSSEGSTLTCKQLVPIPSSEYPTPARRPLNSRLDCTKVRNTFGIALPHWEEGLKECFGEVYAGNGLRDRRS